MRLKLAIVDDDEAVLDALTLFLRTKGISTSCFSSGAELITSLQKGLDVDCIVSDVNMPGLDGLSLCRQLSELLYRVPVILITGHGDIDLAVAAIKDGVHDFIQKPFDEQRLLTSVVAAVEASNKQALDAEQLRELADRVSRLSDRQREVMELAATGLTNKEIAAKMGIGTRTVESYRSWVMERLDARNLADLIRIAMKTGIVK